MPRDLQREAFERLLHDSDTDDDLGPVNAQKRAHKVDLPRQQYQLATSTAPAKIAHAKEEVISSEDAQDGLDTHDNIKIGTELLFSELFGGSGSPVKNLEGTQSLHNVDEQCSSTLRAEDGLTDDSFILPNTTYKRKRGLELPKKTSAMVNRKPVTCEYQQSDHAHDEIEEILGMPAEARNTALQRTYAGLYMPLEQMTLPQVYLEKKEAANDVLTQFINNTTFVYTVWLNYDKTMKQFFDDERIQYCGKPRLSVKARTRIKRLQEAGYCLRHVRLVLSTAWNNLGQIDLTFDEEGGYVVKPVLHTDVQSHACLRRFVITMAGRVQKELTAYRAQSLSLDDLDMLGSYFCRSAPPDERYGVFGMHKEWMQPEEGFREWWDHDGKFSRLKWAYENRQSSSYHRYCEY